MAGRNYPVTYEIGRQLFYGGGRADHYQKASYQDCRTFVYERAIPNLTPKSLQQRKFS